MKRKFVILSISVLSLVAFSFLVYRVYLLRERQLKWQVLEKRIHMRLKRFPGTAGVVVKDLKTNWEISVNKDTLFPSASVVKIPVMLACFNAASNGRISIDDTLALKNSDKVLGSGMLKAMPEGAVLSIARLIELMICNSDNTAANMLINLLGFDYLNDYFKQFGLKNTNLSRKMMDFKKRKDGRENYTTASDMAYTLEKIYRGEVLNSNVSNQCLLFLKKQKLRDRLPAKLPPDVVVMHKTGLEYKVCHDVGIIPTPKGDFLVSVLTKGARYSKVAKYLIADIALYVYNHSQ